MKLQKLSAQKTQCANSMRQLSMALLLYAGDYEDQLPRSSHSAFRFRVYPWPRQVYSYLYSKPLDQVPDGQLTEGVFHCPRLLEPGRRSYGINVYFELSENDEYRGWPRSWRKITSPPNPVQTILLAENNNSSDHVMAHFWDPDPPTEIDDLRHGPSAHSNYTFLDGHSEFLEVKDTFNPEANRDWWNPLR